MAKSLSEKLRMIRGSMTQTEMAELMGVPQGYISRYEKGVVSPSIYYVYNLGKHFNVSLDWLLADEGDMYVTTSKKKKDKIAPEIVEVVNILKTNKHLARTLKQILGKKDSERIMQVVNKLPTNKLRATIEMLQ